MWWRWSLRLISLLTYGTLRDSFAIYDVGAPKNFSPQMTSSQYLGGVTILYGACLPTGAFFEAPANQYDHWISGNLI
jgi:hypothetical protein